MRQERKRRRIMKAAGHLSTEDLTWLLARQVTTLKRVRACWQRMWTAERLAACKDCVAAIWNQIWNQMPMLQTDRTCCKLHSILARNWLPVWVLLSKAIGWRARQMLMESSSVLIRKPGRKATLWPSPGCRLLRHPPGKNSNRCCSLQSRKPSVARTYRWPI